MRGVGVLAVCATSAGCFLGVHPPPPPQRNAQLGLSFATVSLANGLRAVVVSDPSAVEVHVTTRIQVGAADDPAGQAGMAHLVEHLTFDLQASDEPIFARLPKIATAYNAFTTLDATTFVARARPEQLEGVLDIEAARIEMRCASIDDAEFARERDVVVNEVRQNVAADAVDVAIRESLFPVGHPYRVRGRGTVDGLHAITREQACAFAAARYAPSNVVVVISGNLTRQQVEAALAKRLARLAAHDPAQPTPVIEPEFDPRHVELEVPVDQPALVIAWPLPNDVATRAKHRALIANAAEIIEAASSHRAAFVELGGSHAPLVGLVVTARGDSPYAYLIDDVARVLGQIPELFRRTDIQELDALGFGRMQNDALYRAYARMSDGVARDSRLAGYVSEGIDPARAIAAEIEGIEQLGRREAIELVREHFRLSTATVIALRPRAPRKTGHRVAVGSPAGERIDRSPVADPQDAHRAASGAAAAWASQARITKLANGMQMVMVPDETVPTVDIRLVFRAGAADEPASRRGVATLAAHALTFDLRYAKDVLRFVGAGGTSSVAVAADSTTFRVRGMGSQLDFLLAGLRRWVVDGTYGSGVDALVRTVRRERMSKSLHEDVLAWREAVYGHDHPYVKAGLVYEDDDLTAVDAREFRAAHLVPDNATLVIAGRFDPAVVERWASYLFGDWRGHGAPRRGETAALRPTSLARADDIDQIDLEIALPAAAGARAARLVVAEMLSILASDIRHELGASYDVDARLLEERLGTSYRISGAIDASRAAPAMKLLVEHLARLHREHDLAARMFVVARQRVLMRLSSRGDTAAVANRIENDIDRARPLLEDLATADDVRVLTIDQVGPALADLELASGAISMRGPAEDVERAFAELGRKPTYIRPAPAQPPPPPAMWENAAPRRAEAMPRELVDPLTSPSYSVHVAASVGLGYSFVNLFSDKFGATCACSGPSASMNLGVRRRGTTRAGLHAAIASLNGSMPYLTEQSTTYTVVDGGAFVQLHLQDRFWVEAHGGIRFEHELSTRSGPFAGLEFDLDLVRLGPRPLGLFLREELADVGDGLQNATTGGLTYRY